mmetsp:Transcript_10914/g.33466  ORF Transcript_10914/g.33466 Transcript_10914/m.33466 type:complete len:280 (+) Transcript_10914:104-943(+)
MTKVLQVEDVLVVVPRHYGRRRRCHGRKSWCEAPCVREDGESLDSQDGARADECILKPEDVEVKVNMEAEEALFYSEDKMSDVELLAVTGWLTKFEDITLDLFARMLKKEMSQVDASLAEEMFAADGKDSRESRSTELSRKLAALEQRMHVVRNALSRVPSDDKAEVQEGYTDEGGEEEEPDGYASRDPNLASRLPVKVYLKDFVDEVAEKSDRIENRLQRLLGNIFFRRKPARRVEDKESPKSRSSVEDEESNAGFSPPQDLPLPAADGQTVHNEFFV